MRRSRRLLLAGTAVAVVAAITGALVAIGLGDDDGAASTPTGTHTVLRVQPVEGKVSCGPGGAAAYIYLDDLEFRPSPNDATVAYGVAGWQLALEYDPNVLRVANATDVVLNPLLSQEDADRDGIARSFFPAVYMDDGAGRVLVGGASLVAAGEELRDEEGLDPVAKGEPLLLMTVRFLTVGQGTTSLTLGDPGKELPAPLAPGIYDNTGKPYEPRAFTDAAITVEGGDCPADELNTPRPTIAPSATTFASPTRAIPTPEVITPTPASLGGRPDCKEDLSAYNDPDARFSLCYPPDWTAVSSPPHADFGTAVSFVRSPSLLTLYWKQSSYFDSPDFQDRCRIAPDWDGKQQVNLEIAGRTVLACVGLETLHDPDAPPLRSTFAEIPLGEGNGYLVMFSTEPDDISQEDAASTSGLVATLKLR